MLIQLLIIIKFVTCFYRILVVLLSGAVAAVPSSSLVVLLMVSRAVGFPVADRMGLLIMVDWFKCV